MPLNKFRSLEVLENLDTSGILASLKSPEPRFQDFGCQKNFGLYQDSRSNRNQNFQDLKLKSNDGQKLLQRHDFQTKRVRIDPGLRLPFYWKIYAPPFSLNIVAHRAREDVDEKVALYA